MAKVSPGKLLINCFLVAGLTAAGLFVYLSLPQFTLEPLQWAGQNFDRPMALAFWFVYTASIWAVIAAVMAWIMLYLKPGHVVLFGLVSAATFIVLSQSWSLVSEGNAYAYVREIVLVLTLPVLYCLFVRIAHRKSVEAA